MAQTSPYETKSDNLQFDKIKNQFLAISQTEQISRKTRKPKVIYYVELEDYSPSIQVQTSIPKLNLDLEEEEFEDCITPTPEEQVSIDEG